jgi:hypothetical protein
MSLTLAQPARPVPIQVGIYLAAITIAALLTTVGQVTAGGLVLFGGAVPYAFVLFVLVLLGIAMFHHHTLQVALGGAFVITAYTALLAPDGDWAVAGGLWGHFVHEGEHTLLNLGGLLLGFALLADFFERSHLPLVLPRLLPKASVPAAFALLAAVWTMSGFLDNIAAAMIGGVLATTVFHGRVTMIYLAAIVASSNAGGAFSVVGDTTTTMMWIDGVAASDVLHAVVASFVALLVFGIPAARAQARHQPVERNLANPGLRVDVPQLAIVALILAGAIATNIAFDRPFLGVWGAILLGALWRRPRWSTLPPAARGAAFLLSLVWCASLMPVEALPAASWSTALSLGFVSAVFDNIPLTKLALEQGGYDWGVLAFAVGFGGSMLWFGSSAGVALSAAFPQMRRTGHYLYASWPIVLAYVLGFAAMLLVWGWHPHEPHRM